MKLMSLELSNYRQFFGRQEIAFSASKDRNVTIVFGANGAGKTTLLSAFTWCLYGVMPPALESPKQLVNERAWNEAPDGTTVSATVRLRFSHDEYIYECERTQTQRKIQGLVTIERDGGYKDLRVSVTKPTGETDSSVTNPNDKIQQILPMELHRSFFFDGERMENLVKQKSSKDISEAIKKILGLERIERAIDHLKSACEHLDRELAQVLPASVKKEVDALMSGIDAKNAEFDDCKAKWQLERANLESLEDELEAVAEALRVNEQSSALQKERDELEATLKRNQQRLHDVTRRQQAVISRKGFLAFTPALTAQTLARVDQVRERGQIPTPIKRQFVEDLLERASCICGTPLIPGSPPHSAVAEWRERAIAAGAEEAWTNLGAQAKQFNFDRQELLETLRGCIEERAGLTEEYRQTRDRMGEIQTLLGKTNSAEIQDLANRQVDLTTQIQETNRQIGRLQGDIDRLTREIQELVDARRIKTAQIGQADIAAQRESAASEAYDFFVQLLEIKTDDTRKQLDRRIKDIYRSISYKDYTPELTQDFSLELYKDVGDRRAAVAKSTGENQILSLAFVGAVAAYARELNDEAKSRPSIGGFEGGIFPIVMDSPFGALDEGYREQIAAAIPALAEQIVVFVSKSQGLGIVLQQLGPRIDRRFVIDYQTTKPGAEPETIELGQQRYPYITPSGTASEWAQLREV